MQGREERGTTLRLINWIPLSSPYKFRSLLSVAQLLGGGGGGEGIMARAIQLEMKIENKAQ